MRVALITGASRGLGAAIARRLARDHAVAVHFRAQEARATGVVSEIVAAGGRAMAVRFDLADRAAIAAGVDAVVDGLGPVDVLVNNAAITADGWFAMGADADWDAVVAANLTGARDVTKAVVRGMLGRGGAVVNVASAAGIRGGAGQTAYAATKGGLLALTRALAVELAPRGIRVNAVVPGILDGGMAARMDRAAHRALLDHVPARRAGTLDEVAEVVAFLASDAASYVVGAALAVDGGLTA